MEDKNGKTLVVGQTVTMEFKVVGFDGALTLIKPATAATEGMPGLTAVNGIDCTVTAEAPKPVEVPTDPEGNLHEV